jgi:hypothetical protein
MADRLNSLAFAHHLNMTGDPNGYLQNFNPRSVSFDIRTPQELAAVNEFLLTLGRDVAAGAHRQPHLPSPDEFTPQSYFDQANLSQLGLAGMPGLSASGPGYSADSAYAAVAAQYASAYHASQQASRSSHPSSQPTPYNSMFFNDQAASFSPAEFSNPPRRMSGKFSHSGIPPTSSFYHRPMSPLETGSPHSSISTPANDSMPDTASFDFIRASRGQPPVAQISPADFMGKSMRTIVPLKAVPGGRPEPIEPKFTAAVHRGPPAKLTAAAVSPLPRSSSSSLYPLLTSGDIQYKLPPLNHIYRSPSPAEISRSDESKASDDEAMASPPSPSTPAPVKCTLPPLSRMYRSPSPVGSPPAVGDSRESTPSSVDSPPIQHSNLSHLRTSSSSSTGRAESEELAREVDMIELENRTKEISLQERKRHAELILSMLVTINKDFKKRFGSPVPAPTTISGGRKLLFSESSRDVEMTVA